MEVRSSQQELLRCSSYESSAVHECNQPYPGIWEWATFDRFLPFSIEEIRG